MFRNIFDGKIVLVTGDTGFKGTWLAIWLKELGAEVVGYALDPPSEPGNFAAAGMKARITHVHGDVLDFAQVIAVFEKYRPEFVFHLAAQAVVRLSYNEPKLTFDTNVGGTVNILEAVRRTPSIRVLVNVTSDKCYENRERIWGYRESDPMGGHDPYSASKGCAELVFAAYLKSFFSGATSGNQRIGAGSCRAGNAIGGGDWGQDRLIPDCVRALIIGKAIRIRNPRSIRPWQHVLELISGYLWLGARLWEAPDRFSGGWNFGPGNVAHLTVAEVVSRFIDAWGSGDWQDMSELGAVHEANVLKLCCDKATFNLGWRNVLSMDQAISMTAEWYKMFYSGASQESIYSLCTKQIEEYTAIAKGEKLQWSEEYSQAPD